jgi:hypothetical protein
MFECCSQTCSHAVNSVECVDYFVTWMADGVGGWVGVKTLHLQLQDHRKIPLQSTRLLLSMGTFNSQRCGLLGFCRPQSISIIVVLILWTSFIPHIFSFLLSNKQLLRDHASSVS